MGVVGEQSRLGLDEDAAAGQSFELGADVLGGLGRDRQVQGRAQVAGAQGAAEVGEGVKDLLAGGVVREGWRRPGWFCGGLAVVGAGEGDEGLAGDLQVVARAIDTYDRKQLEVSVEVFIHGIEAVFLAPCNDDARLPRATNGPTSCGSCSASLPAWSRSCRR
jgi:hypothetical protein